MSLDTVKLVINLPSTTETVTFKFTPRWRMSGVCVWGREEGGGEVNLSKVNIESAWPSEHAYKNE